jgi:hypothetical protein
MPSETQINTKIGKKHERVQSANPNTSKFNKILNFSRPRKSYYKMVNYDTIKQQVIERKASPELIGPHPDPHHIEKKIPALKTIKQLIRMP